MPARPHSDQTQFRTETGNIPQRRADEILQWCERRITVEEAIGEVERDEDHIRRVAIPDPLVVRILWIAFGGFLIDLFRRAIYGPRQTGSEQFREWVSRFDLSAAELWTYDSGGDSWERLRGECGFAVVADGRLVDFWMWFEN